MIGKEWNVYSAELFIRAGMYRLLTPNKNHMQQRIHIPSKVLVVWEDPRVPPILLIFSN